MNVKITESEKKVLNLIYLTNPQIAEKLMIALPTVKAHVHRLLIKFKAKTRTELIYKVFQDKNIDLLQAQNEGLKKQNIELQTEIKTLKKIVKYLLEINRGIKND